MQVVVTSDDSPVTLIAPRFGLNYRTDGRPPSPENLAVTLHDGTRVWCPGDRPSRNLGGTLSTLDGLRGPRPVGHGLLSRDGWALIDDSDGHLLQDDWAVCRSWRGYDVDGRIDWYLFVYGDDFASALRALSIISGPVPLPRRSTLGSWYSRYWPHTSDDFRAIAREFDSRGFPLDVMVLDMDWHSGSAQGRWTGWSWNRDLLPDAERLLDWLHERGLNVCLNLHPAEGVGSWEERYAPFMRALGLDPITGERLPFDAGNKRAMRALFEEVLAPLERSGVDLWWLDWQQEAIVRSIPGLTNLAWLNRLFFRHARTNGRRGTGFSRWAGWGDHRHPIHFSGDAHTGWPMLAFQVPFTVTAGNVGCFFWSHDIGGHFGPRLEEASTRWVQFGAMSGSLRLHSAREPTLDRRPWSFGPEHERAMRKAFRLRSALMPTIYTAARAAARDTLPLIRPVWLATGAARVPADEHAFRSPDQYLIGNDLLVAPITTRGIGSDRVTDRAVWFPPTPSGAWTHLETGERFPAGRHALVAAMLDEIPVFARAGTAIVMQPPSPRMTACFGAADAQPSGDRASARTHEASEQCDAEQACVQHLVLRVFAPATFPFEFETRLYEDDGESEVSEHGDSATTRLSGRWDAENDDRVTLDLTIHGADGHYSDQPKDRRWTIELADPGVSIEKLRGRVAFQTALREATGPSELPAARCLLTPTCNIRESLSLQITMLRSDPLRSSLSHRARRLSGMLDTPVGLADLYGPLSTLGRSATPQHEALLNRAWAVADGLGPVWRTVGPCAQPGVAPPVVVIADPFDHIDASRPVRLELIDRVGDLDSVVESQVFSARSVPTMDMCLWPTTDRPAEPPVGRAAIRSVRLTAVIHGSERVITRHVETRRRPIRAWRVQGPFDWDWRWGIGMHALPPEQTEPVDSDSMQGLFSPHHFPPHPHAPPITPMHGVQADARSTHTSGWTLGRTSAFWGLDLAATFPDRRGAAWAEAVVISSRRQQADLLFETADKLLVRLHNHRVFVLDDHSGTEAESMTCRCELREGWNLLQVKLTHGWNDWGLNLFIDAPHPVEEQPVMAE
ncbi:MAG: DUF5110 domain-containing protein [Phycisphaeraceae bacterium]|nr:DUF5110 domain-containing protein [Phycisphaeraceae bacterium]